MRGFTKLSCLALYLGGTLGCARNVTVRVVEGREVLGERISELAYAAYLRGNLSEAQGQLAEAETQYRAAIASFESAELRSSLGRVLCQQGNSAGALSEFAQAETLDADYAPLFIARANCSLSEQHWADALRDAQRAQGLDPDNRDATRAAAQSLQALGQTQLARQWLYAYAALHPAKQTPTSIVANSSALPLCTPYPAETLQAAVRKSDRAVLDAYSAACRVSPFRLAAFALELGRSALAFELALQALAVAPGDADTRALVLLAGIRTDRQELTAQTLLGASAATIPLTDLGRRWLNEAQQLLVTQARTPLSDR